MNTALLLLLAAQCPQLTGTYNCPLSNGQYSPLEIAQQTLSLEPELTEYSFNYTSIPGDPDVFLASPTGERDDFGYTNYCHDKRIVSISENGHTKAEMYRDPTGALVQTQNDQTVMSCPKTSP